MKIAIVSTDGVNVDEHFGKAERFLIYEAKEAGLTLIESRDSIPLSVNDLNHPFDPDRFDKIYSVIQDCKKVYMTQIGEVPKAKLEERGIEPCIYKGLIQNIKI